MIYPYDRSPIVPITSNCILVTGGIPLNKFSSIKFFFKVNLNEIFIIVCKECIYYYKLLYIFNFTYYEFSF